MTNDELKALCESNARGVQANTEQGAETDRKINNLADIVQAFIAKLDSDGLKVTLVTSVIDDVAGEAVELEKTVNNHSVAITVLIGEANKDRQTFKGEMAAERRESARRFDAAINQANTDRRQSDDRFQAMQENLQRLFLEVRSTNMAVAGLGDRADRAEGRLDTLEQAG